MAAATGLSEQRYRHLFDRFHREVFAYCRRRADPHTASDAAAETFLVAWRRIDDVPEGDAALRWLYGVARRVLSNEFRTDRRRRGLVNRLRRSDSEPDPTPDVVVVRREQDLQVLAAMARTRPEDQEVLRLALWEQVPHAEIAEMLGCSTQAATQRVYRATRPIWAGVEREVFATCDSAGAIVISRRPCPHGCRALIIDAARTEAGHDRTSSVDGDRHRPLGGSRTAQ